MVGDVGNLDYKVSMDMAMGERPVVKLIQFN